MEAGKMRHRIAILRNANSVDSLGQVPDDPVVVATVWGRIETLQGREAEAARALVPQATTRVTMRYHAGVTETCQLTHRNAGAGTEHVYNIGNINNVEQNNVTLILTCSEPKNV